jgi:hypothetical protein
MSLSFDQLRKSVDFKDFLNNEFDNLSMDEQAELLFGDCEDAAGKFEKSDYYDPADGEIGFSSERELLKDQYRRQIDYDN